jgi:hypothetical protein
MTTVEVDTETLERLKTAKEMIRKRFNIKIRMLDIMSHLATSPEDIVERVSISINKKADK